MGAPPFNLHTNRTPESPLKSTWQQPMIPPSLYVILHDFLKSAQIPSRSPGMPGTPTLPRKSPHAALPCVTSLVYPTPCLVVLQVFAFHCLYHPDSRSAYGKMGHIFPVPIRCLTYSPCPMFHPLFPAFPHSPGFPCFAVPGSLPQSSLHLIPGFQYIP